MKNDLLREKTFHLAVRMVNLNRYLTGNQKEYIISKQIIRSGTSPGAMIREASNAESGADFVHKLSIALKETCETQFWLDLLFTTGYLSSVEYQSLYEDTETIRKLLTSSILTKKKKLQLSNIKAGFFLAFMFLTTILLLQS